MIGTNKPVIEQFSHEYQRFFDEPSYQVRWKRLRTIYSKDYGSFRVLFFVEAMGLLDKWREPTSAELNAILRHLMAGRRIAIQLGSVIDLFQPVWPLEVAKYEYLVHRATWGDSAFRRKYFMTSIRSHITALVQTWWAFETLMNDFAGIIAKERKANLDPMSMVLLDEKRPTIDKTGSISFESYYQPLLLRFQFIYRLLTGEKLDRGSLEWRHLVELKDMRDAYIHRIGKGGGPTALGDDTILVNGFSAVRSILARVLTKTPEFAARFIYKYLAFWSCGSESPFIWDGREGNSFYLGLGSVKKEMVAAVFAPMPGSFSAKRVAVPSAATGPPRPSPSPTRRSRKRR